MIFLPISAVIISLVLAILVLKQYVTKKKPYQLMWGIAFAMFSIASLADTLASANGWNIILLKIYYLFGATLLVGFLGMGTIFLLWGGRIAKISLGVLLTASVISIILIMPAKINDVNLIKLNSKLQSKTAAAYLSDQANSGNVYNLDSEQSLILAKFDDPNDKDKKKALVSDALDKHIALRIIAVLLNILGTLALTGGAAYSAYNAYKKKLPKNIFYGTGLLALGSFVIAGGGTATGIAGVAPQIVLTASITIGISVMFIGFLFTSQKPKPQGETK